MPLSLKNSAIEVAEYGAKNCIGAGADDGAEITVVYGSAPFFSKILVTRATVDAFCPTAT